jgi:uncharacterized protein (TIGR02996 family)
VSVTLDEALEAFARHRSSVITRVIVKLGHEAAAGITPPQHRKNLEFHRAWLAAAVDPHRRSWCLATLLDRLPKLHEGKEAPYGDKLEALLERLGVLAEASPDPRIWRAMIAAFELRSPIIGSVDAHVAMARLVEQHADDETRAACSDGHSDELAQLRLPGPVKLDKRTAERFAGVVTRAAPKQDVSTMLRAVYDAPDDDGPRAVLADYLQEQGDPRGEFIALQLREASGDATPEIVDRAQELAKAHAKAWFGALRPIVYRAEFRRGFLARLELAGSWSSSKWQQHVADPALSTLEELLVGQATGAELRRMLLGPVVGKNLRAIAIESNDVWEAVRERALPHLKRVTSFAWKRGNYEQKLVNEVIPFIERTLAITHVGCQLELVSQFSKQLLARLVSLETRADVSDLWSLWTKHPHLRTLTSDWSDVTELVRDGKDTYVRYRPSTFTKDTGHELLELPKSVKRIEVIGNAAFLKRAQPVLKGRFTLVARPLPSGLVSGNKG